MKVVVIGGGSSYTPELIDGFIRRSDRLIIDELWLVDIEEGLEKLDAVGNLAIRMFRKANIPTKITMTTNRIEAIKNADFVVTQFRVGQLQARGIDELVPAKYNLLGQETNGFGGLFKALRTVPVVEDIVKEVQLYAPNAFVINFTNPAGIVSEYINRYTDFKKLIGVCNVPVGMQFGIADILKVERDRVLIDFLGLNHMVFGHKVFLDDKDVTEMAITKYCDTSITMNNIYDIPFENIFIKALKLLPCPYHRYYYKYNAMLKHQTEEYESGMLRAEEVMKLEKTLFEKYRDPSLNTKPIELESRGGAYYSDVACDVICSIYNDEGKIHAVNIKNSGHVTNVSHDDTLEISCRITKDGAIPLNRITELNRNVKGIYELFKTYEIVLCEAIYEKDLNKVILAANLSPFTRDDITNIDVFNELYDKHAKYLRF